MAVNFEGSVVNLRDKLVSVDRKKQQSETAQGVKKGESNSADSEKKYIADVVGIRNENRLAAASNRNIQSHEEAQDVLEELKSQLFNDSKSALDAHKKASPDAVMQFYPFE
jgi:hypothetical protein